MRTKCANDIKVIVAGYNNYFHEILWKEDYPNPNGGPSVNWFDGAILAVRKTFAAHQSIITKLPAVGGLAEPSPLDPGKIKNANDLRKALAALPALPPLPQGPVGVLPLISDWVTQMAAVAAEMNSKFGSCINGITGGYTMIYSLQEELSESLKSIKGVTPPEVCERALDWIRTFFYWQQALGMWEQIIADHCLQASGNPPSPSAPLRVELSNPTGQALITVIQLPSDLDRARGPYRSFQIPPPKWPPWS